MTQQRIELGELVCADKSLQLFSFLMKKSADGAAFSPELGPHVWHPGEMAVVIDSFELPFESKRLYRILFHSGGTGWAWEEFVHVLSAERSI